MVAERWCADFDAAVTHQGKKIKVTFLQPTMSSKENVFKDYSGRRFPMFPRRLMQAISHNYRLELDGDVLPSLENNDLKVKVGREVIYCKRYVMMRISPVFQFLSSNFDLRDQTVVLEFWTGIEPESFRLFRDTLYNDDYNYGDLDLRKTLDLLLVSASLKVRHVAGACCRRALALLTPSTCYLIWIVADWLRIMKLLSVAEDMLAEHFDQIVAAVQVLPTAFDHTPVSGMRYLLNHPKFAPQIEALGVAVLFRWFLADWSRWRHAGELLPLINFARLDPEWLMHNFYVVDLKFSWRHDPSRTFIKYFDEILSYQLTRKPKDVPDLNATCSQFSWHRPSLKGSRKVLVLVGGCYHGEHTRAVPSDAAALALAQADESVKKKKKLWSDQPSMRSYLRSLADNDAIYRRAWRQLDKCGGEMDLVTNWHLLTKRTLAIDPTLNEDSLFSLQHTPYSLGQRFASCTLWNTLYVSGGDVLPFVFGVYRPWLNKWVTFGDFLPDGRMDHCMVAYRDKLVILGGLTTPDVQPQWRRWAPTTSILMYRLRNRNDDDVAATGVKKGKRKAGQRTGSPNQGEARLDGAEGAESADGKSNTEWAEFDDTRREEAADDTTRNKSANDTGRAGLGEEKRAEKADDETKKGSANDANQAGFEDAKWAELGEDLAGLDETLALCPEEWVDVGELVLPVYGAIAAVRGHRIYVAGGWTEKGVINQHVQCVDLFTGTVYVACTFPPPCSRLVSAMITVSTTTCIVSQDGVTYELVELTQDAERVEKLILKHHVDRLKGPKRVRTEAGSGGPDTALDDVDGETGEEKDDKRLGTRDGNDSKGKRSGDGCVDQEDAKVKSEDSPLSIGDEEAKLKREGAAPSVETDSSPTDVETAATSQRSPAERQGQQNAKESRESPSPPPTQGNQTATVKSEDHGKVESGQKSPTEALPRKAFSLEAVPWGYFSRPNPSRIWVEPTGDPGEERVFNKDDTIALTAVNKSTSGFFWKALRKQIVPWVHEWAVMCDIAVEDAVSQIADLAAPTTSPAQHARQRRDCSVKGDASSSSKSPRGGSADGTSSKAKSALKGSTVQGDTSSTSRSAQGGSAAKRQTSSSKSERGGNSRLSLSKLLELDRSDDGDPFSSWAVLNDTTPNTWGPPQAELSGTTQKQGDAGSKAPAATKSTTAGTTQSFSSKKRATANTNSPNATTSTATGGASPGKRKGPGRTTESSLRDEGTGRGTTESSLRDEGTGRGTPGGHPHRDPHSSALTSEQRLKTQPGELQVMDTVHVAANSYTGVEFKTPFCVTSHDGKLFIVGNYGIHTFWDLDNDGQWWKSKDMCMMHGSHLHSLVVPERFLMSENGGPQGIFYINICLNDYRRRTYCTRHALIKGYSWFVEVTMDKPDYMSVLVFCNRGMVVDKTMLTAFRLEIFPTGATGTQPTGSIVKDTFSVVSDAIRVNGWVKVATMKDLIRTGHMLKGSTQIAMTVTVVPDVKLALKDDTDDSRTVGGKRGTADAKPSGKV